MAADVKVAGFWGEEIGHRHLRGDRRSGKPEPGAEMIFVCHWANLPDAD